jgi:hypothetical protein
LKSLISVLKMQRYQIIKKTCHNLKIGVCQTPLGLTA